MPVIVHTPPGTGLSREEVERWRPVPAAIAIDLGGDIGQIDPAVAPLRPRALQARLFGPALTVRCEPPDFGAVLYALDLIRPGDVLLIAAGGRADTAMIGDILGGHLRARGGVGLVCDGAVRDTDTLAGWDDFPVYARHVNPRGPISIERGAVNCPVVAGGTIVRPGDILIGDADGLAVLPPSAVRTRIGDAEARLAREDGWRAALASGRSFREIFSLPDPASGVDPAAAGEVP
jgi:regulator of RNase E activity RraA